MAAVDVLKFSVSSPADTSPLKDLKERGYDPNNILGIIGKSEGNGCVNDFSRTLSTTVWEPLIPSLAVTVFSGGTEGVLSPHVTFIMKAKAPQATGLLAAVGQTREFQPHEIGTSIQAREVASSVRSMFHKANLTEHHIHMVLIKCPLITSSKVEAIKAAGQTPVTIDTYDSMAKSRYASAIGVSVALGELANSNVDEAIQNENHWSTKVSCSSGAELENCHILVIATEEIRGNLRAVSGYMKDAIDASAILKALDQVREENGTVVQVFAKAEADPRGKIRGKRHTMNTDSDLHSTRHARAAVGGLIAGLVGDTELYVSGGAEGQGPPGGGPLCVLYRV